MVIQRIQTLLLLLTVALMTAALFLPAASTSSGAPVYITDFPILMIVDILVAALLFIGIFMFKNLKAQMRVTLVSILLICAVAAGGVFYLWRGAEGAQIEYFGAAILLICSVLSAALAYRYMKRDHKLLRSADRLR